MIRKPSNLAMCPAANVHPFPLLLGGYDSALASSPQYGSNGLHLLIHFPCVSFVLESRLSPSKNNVNSLAFVTKNTSAYIESGSYMRVVGLVQNHWRRCGLLPNCFNVLGDTCGPRESHPGSDCQKVEKGLHLSPPPPRIRYPVRESSTSESLYPQCPDVGPRSQTKPRRHCCVSTSTSTKARIRYGLSTRTSTAGGTQRVLALSRGGGAFCGLVEELKAAAAAVG
eukprot:scaffold143380_cov45-Prasinocladus_malaysianus.AAC.2